MKNLLFTRKQLTLAGLFFVFIVVVVIWAACSTKTEAAEPKISDQLFVAASARYVTDLGGGLGMGYQFRNGIMLTALVTYDQINGPSGTVPFRVGCQRYSVPYQAGDYGHRGAEIIVHIPVKARK